MNKKISLIFACLFLGLFLIGNLFALSEEIYLDDYKLEYSYNSVEEGDTFTLKITITNEDSAKSNVEFSIKDDEPFDVDGSKTWSIGDLTKNETVSKSFRIEVDDDTKSGNYDLEIELEDNDDNYNEDLEIEVDSDKADLVIGDISSSPAIITPDEENIKLEITIENIGSGDAEFTKTELILPDGVTPTTAYSDIENLELIKEGESKVATFHIDTSKNLKTSDLTAEIILNYKTDSNNEKTTLEFDLPIMGKPQFTILSSSVNPSKLIPGSKGKLYVNIQNIGEEKGEETTLRIFENSDLPIEFNEKTNLIGTLEPSQTGISVFDFEVDDDATATTYLIKIQTRTINKDNVLVEEYTLPVIINQAPKKEIPFVLIIFSVFTLGLIYGFFRILKKK